MSIRRRLPSITIVLAILTASLAGTLAAGADRSAGASPRHLAGCSTCPRPPEQPR